ncbi:MAG TPA: prenyltransferase/squalene oxidase repeat-containing protein [Pseudonocardiaceae bacterium]|nr:prenyltransferase/squalene oxidase repeat-containing protein [Pseudonocardiaceae bacterium]
MRFLLDQQNRDGSWGAPDGYGVLPTLSTTGALLSMLRGPPAANGSVIGRHRMIDSAGRGLNRLAGWLNTGATVSLPDTVAVEILVPYLVGEINEFLAGHPPPELPHECRRRLNDHPDTDRRLLTTLRAAAAAGEALPTKLMHSFEAFGDAGAMRSVEPKNDGIGCSPAATAVWLSDPARRTRHLPTLRYLRAVQDRDNGAVPVAAPLATFERAWVLSTLAGVGLVPPGHRRLARQLHSAFGEFGVAAGPGLPADADDTAVALCALARLGSARSPDCLLAYQQSDGHFACFPGERTPSCSANAHVLQAFGACLATDPARSSRYRGTMARLAAWLIDHQAANGSWQDKWHASPYYATACCVLALADRGDDRAADALDRAAEWVLDTQRPDGSWGRWTGTPEETAYAIRVLCGSKTVGSRDATTRAIAAGRARLLPMDEQAPQPSLWHDKDLYTPIRIVRAERLAALRMADVHLRVAGG